jgi:hypothetical protein
MRLLSVMGIMLVVSGCSSLETVDNTPKESVRMVKPAPPRIIQPRVLPDIPEIQAPRVITPHRYKRATVQIPKRPRYKVRTKPQYKAPTIGRYPGSVSPKVSTTAIGVQARKEVQQPATLKEDGGIDPYANIPDNAGGGSSNTSRIAPSSVAVETLLVRAYADAKLGRTDAAMSKLERGLRIEPQNPKLWNQLAELHYKKRNYKQAIAMAKKAINYSSSNQEMTEKNWHLISEVAEKSGDSRAMAEVNEYNKRQ